MALKKNKAITNLLVKSKPKAWEPPQAIINGTRLDLGPPVFTGNTGCIITKCNKKAVFYVLDFQPVTHWLVNSAKGNTLFMVTLAVVHQD